MAESKETKNQRISKTQKTKLVEYMSTHLEFARGQFGGINANIQNKGDWLALTSILNSLGGSKTTEQWKKCWIDLKGGVKRRQTAGEVFFNKTGGGSLKGAPQDLNDFEEQILAIMGTHAIHGDSTSVEGGVPPLAEPFFSVEVIEEDMDQSYDLPLVDLNASDQVDAYTSDGPSSSKQATKSLHQKKTPPVNFKAGIEEAREMHAAVVQRIEKIETKLEKVHEIVDNIQKQNNDLLIKFECMLNLLHKNM